MVYSVWVRYIFGEWKDGWMDENKVYFICIYILIMINFKNFKWFKFFKYNEFYIVNVF